MAESYLPALFFVLFALAFAGANLGIAMVLGPKRTSAIKDEPFECGSEPIGSPRVKFSVKFYQVAILFLVFDIRAEVGNLLGQTIQLLEKYGCVQFLHIY